MRILSLLSSFAFVYSVSIANGQQSVLELNTISTEYELTARDFLLLVDTSNSLSPKIINSKDLSAKFIPVKGDVAYIQDMNATYWLKFKVKGSEYQRWILENLDLHIEHFSLFIESDDGLQEIGSAGFDENFKNRKYNHKNFVFDLPTPKGTVNTFYIRAASSQNHNPFYIKIRKSDKFNGYANTEYYLLGIFYGILLIMAIYNLVIFFTLRNKAYLAYVGYVLIAIAMSMVEDGTGFQFVWPNSPWLNWFLWNTRSLLFLWAITIYSVYFLNLRRQLKKWYLLVLTSAVIYTIFYLIVISAVSNPNVSLLLRTSIYLAPLSVILISAIKIYSKGTTHARYFLLGFAFILIGQCFQLLRESGLVYLHDLITVYSVYFGLIIETVIFSYALADRIRSLKAEKQRIQQELIVQLKEKEELTQKVNRELEQKVQERTVQLNEKVDELDKANSKLLEQSEEISTINSQLDYQNWQLQRDISDLSKARVFEGYVSFEEFEKIFSDEKACLKFLADLKWQENFSCRKCNYDKFYTNAGMNFARRCTKCGYSESPTVYTVFHRVRFDMTKAFYLLYSVYEKGERFKSVEMSEELDMRLNTVWKFSTRVQERMDTMQSKSLKDWTSLIIES